MSRPKAALFDFDGTLIDTSPGIIRVAKETGRQMGLPLPPDQAFRFFIGPPLMDSFRQVYGLDEEDALRASDIYRKLYDDTNAEREAEIYPGMMKLLRDAKAAGIQLGVASMKRQPLVDRMMDLYELTPLFDSVQGAPSPPARGHKPTIMLRALEELGAAPEDAVMIGDSGYDGDAARDTGTPFVGVTWGFGFDDRNEILRYPDARIADTMDDLRRILLG